MKNQNALQVVSLQASFFVRLLLKFSSLISLYFTIISPKVNSVKSADWREEFLKPPHMLPLRPSLPAASL